MPLPPPPLPLLLLLTILHLSRSRSSTMLRALILLAAAAVATAAKPGPFYDCPLREIARDYTSKVILKGWNAKTSAAALALVSEGLRLDRCNISAQAPPAAAAALSSSPPTAATGVAYYVATTGSDSAAGTAAAPLATIAGAQKKIRTAHPTVLSRPPIAVYVGAGDYFYGSAGHDHLEKATRYSSTASKYAMATFSAADSGSSAAAPITYTAAPGAATAPRFLGGVALKGLSFTAAGGGLPAGVLKATVPGDVSFDVQVPLLLLAVLLLLVLLVLLVLTLGLAHTGSALRDVGLGRRGAASPRPHPERPPLDPARRVQPHSAQPLRRCGCGCCCHRCCCCRSCSC